MSISSVPQHSGRVSIAQTDECPSRPRKISYFAGVDDILLEPLYIAQAVNIGEYADSPIDRLKQLVDEEEKEEGNGDSRPLFCEMLELGPLDDDDDIEQEQQLVWFETARWIKYEETVEEGRTRFSKPHITLLSIQSLLQLRNCLRRGPVQLDVDVTNFKQLIDAVIKNWVARHELQSASEITAIRKLLESRKLHLVKNRLRPTSLGKSQDLNASDEDQQQQQQSTKEVDMINQNLLRKLPPDSESAVVMVGRVSELSVPLAQFVRLKQARPMHPDPIELPFPVRFLFILLSPHDHYVNEAHLIGKTMGSLFIDEVFKQVAYIAKEQYTIIDAVEEFLSQSLIVPAGKWDPVQRWEPHEDVAPVKRICGRSALCTVETSEFETVVVEKDQLGLRRTGKLFGGLIGDLRRKLPWYPSDWKDFFRGRITQSVAAAIFLFFANVTKIITFGGVMEHMLQKNMAAVENLLSGGICGVIYALTAGQPMAVLSATGPTLIFEAILFDFCQDREWEYLPVRFWVGAWTALFLILLVATDMSALVSLISRFTEEAFATLISVIFIVQAFEELIEIRHEAPLVTDPQLVYNDPCVCNLSNSSQLLMSLGSSPLLSGNLTQEECLGNDGQLQGLQCIFKPDVLMFSVILFFGTFTIAFGIKLFRTSSFLPSTIRNGIADFGVFLAIVLMTAIAHLVALDVPHLHVPTSFHPTLDRGWLVNPLGLQYWLIPLTCIPAIFFTILVVMDQQITAVIINRSDNKLQKSYGYHLDLFVIASLMIICATMGIPFYVAATVISIMHVDSLRLQSECAAPGERPQFLGVKEQRITALVAHIMIGCAVFLTPLIKLVPMPVLLGIFLYMGVVSLIGQQFVQRVLILFMPMKHQPDYPWLRIVHLKRVHLFTAIQIVCLVMLFAVKYTKSISMMFPIMLIVMVCMRMFVLERIFTRKELLALDDPLDLVSDVLRPQTAKRNQASDLPALLAACV